MSTKYDYEGFTYESAAALSEAKKEAEQIRYIREKTNLTDTICVRKLYEKLVEKKTFMTPVGLRFMQELQQSLVSYADEIPCIPVKLGKKQVTGIDVADTVANRQQQIADMYRSKCQKHRIVTIALIVVILAMFFITIMSDRSPFVDAEIAMQEKYAGWAQDLSEKEAELKTRENILEQRESQLQD